MPPLPEAVSPLFREKYSCSSSLIPGRECPQTLLCDKEVLEREHPPHLPLTSSRHGKSLAYQTAIIRSHSPLSGPGVPRATAHVMCENPVLRAQGCSSSLSGSVQPKGAALVRAARCPLYLSAWTSGSMLCSSAVFHRDGW